jgi:hypothetical protein
VRSVRQSDEPDGRGLRLAVGVAATVGLLAGLWLMGYLGFRLGFAPAVRLPELMGGLGDGLATGTLMIISIPRVILRAGMAEPGWLMAGFALIAIAAAGISAVGPRTPGGPRPSTAAVTFSRAGAIGAAINTFLLIWWTASDLRNDKVGELPFEPEHAAVWLGNLRTVAGLDVLAVIAAAVWVVLVLRLAIPLWLRAMAATASFFALGVVTVAMSMSNAAAAQIEAPRSAVFLGDGSLGAALLLGFTPLHVATLRVDTGAAVVELHDRSTVMTVIGRQSIVGLLDGAAENQRRVREAAPAPGPGIDEES